MNLIGGIRRLFRFLSHRRLLLQRCSYQWPPRLYRLNLLQTLHFLPHLLLSIPFPSYRLPHPHPVWYSPSRLPNTTPAEGCSIKAQRYGDPGSLSSFGLAIRILRTALILARMSLGRKARRKKLVCGLRVIRDTKPLMDRVPCLKVGFLLTSDE
jgi:hypothetical protein